MNLCFFLADYYTHGHHTWYQDTIQYQAKSNDISNLDLEIRSKSYVKVKFHRRGVMMILGRKTDSSCWPRPFSFIACVFVSVRTCVFVYMYALLHENIKILTLIMFFAIQLDLESL